MYNACRNLLRASAMTVLAAAFSLNVAKALPGPTPPVADAGPDQTLTAGANGTIAVTFNGLASYDPDFGDSIVSYTWVNGFPATPGAQPTVVLNTGVHTVYLTVEDEGGLQGVDTVTITVNAPQGGCPTITTPAQNLTVECDGLGDNAALMAWINNHGGAVATAGGSPITWTDNYLPANFVYNNCKCATGHVTVVFTATANGCSVSTSATFTVVDTTAPTLVWYVEGQQVNDSAIYTLTNRDLPITVKVVPVDLCSCAKLTKHTRTTLAGCANVSFCNNTFTITSATVGSSVRFIAKATDCCGNASAQEWVTIKIVQASKGDCHGKGDESNGDEDDDGHGHQGDNDDDREFGCNPGARNKHR